LTKLVEFVRRGFWFKRVVERSGGYSQLLMGLNVERVAQTRNFKASFANTNERAIGGRNVEAIIPSLRQPQTHFPEWQVDFNGVCVLKLLDPYIYIPATELNTSTRLIGKKNGGHAVGIQSEKKCTEVDFCSGTRSRKETVAVRHDSIDRSGCSAKRWVVCFEA
jgi:hypothetical protein